MLMVPIFIYNIKKTPMLAECSLTRPTLLSVLVNLFSNHLKASFYIEKPEEMHRTMSYLKFQCQKIAHIYFFEYIYSSDIIWYTCFYRRLHLVLYVLLTYMTLSQGWPIAEIRTSLMDIRVADNRRPASLSIILGMTGRRTLRPPSTKMR